MLFVFRSVLRTFASTNGLWWMLFTSTTSPCSILWTRVRASARQDFSQTALLPPCGKLCYFAGRIYTLSFQIASWPIRNPILVISSSIFVSKITSNWRELVSRPITVSVYVSVSSNRSATRFANWNWTILQFLMITLSVSVKTLNDTLGPDGLVPSVLVFGENPCLCIFSKHPPARLTNEQRAEIVTTACNEMEKHMAALKLRRSLNHTLLRSRTAPSRKATKSSSGVKTSSSIELAKMWVLFLCTQLTMKRN